MNKNVVIGLLSAALLVMIVLYTSDSGDVAETRNDEVAEVASESSPDESEAVSESEVDANASEAAPVTPNPAPEQSAPAPAPVKTTPVQPVVKPALPTSNAVVLLDTKSGTMITVATLRLAKPGYVAIYRTDSNGRTELMGYSSLIQPGSYTNTLIQIKNPVARKQVVTAVLHEDDGDGKFEFPASDTYLKNGTQLVYDEDVVDIPIVEETGLINGTVEEHLADAKAALLAE